MKKIKLLSAFVLGIALTMMFSFKSNNAGDEQKGLGKVMVIDGKYVFTNCEPVAPYETAFQFKTLVHGRGCPSVQELAEGVVESANKKGFPYDGVIVGNTKYDLAIKFK